LTVKNFIFFKLKIPCTGYFFEYLTSGTFIFGAKPNPQIHRHHSADIGFDHRDVLDHIRASTSDLALGEGNQLIQNLFV
jgi:hypothetical protein